MSLDLDSNKDEEFNHTIEREYSKGTLSANILVAVQNEDCSNKCTTYLGLLDSEESGSLADKKTINAKSTSKGKTSETTWQTKVGTFKTSEEVQVKKIVLSQFTTKRKTIVLHLFSKSKEDTYDFFLDRDFCQQVGLDVLNCKKTFDWDGIQVKMVPRSYCTGSTVK